MHRPLLGRRLLDLVTDRFAKAGDACELHGEPDRFGGRPIVARLERDAGGFVVREAGRESKRRALLADALAEISAEHADRGEWEFVSEPS